MGNAKSKTLRNVKAPKEIQQRNHISISPEVLADVLAFHSRKNLHQQLCQVNSLFFQTANRLPSVHIVPFICLPLIQLVLPCSETISEIPLKNLPIPVPFIRFREVEITNLLEKAALNFLFRSKKSFKSSRLNIAIRTYKPNPGTHLKIQDLLNTLLQEIFVECSQIRIDSRFLEPQKVAKTKGVLASDRLELQFYEEQICDSDSSMALIACLRHKEGQPGARRHLVLKNYPMAGNAEIIEALKKSFPEATQPINYVVTFMESRESIDQSLDRNMRFNLDNTLTGERLSLFDHIPGMGRGVRLWRRIVTDKDDAFSAMLAGERDCDVPEGFDHDFYDVKYKVSHPII
ncbi:hypothetical protein DdX_19291 [Ditylenchus destructor]|uniref:Uncharacterized protein n=1 Tax=Ditylenchus destructor TaxID=166010 RepID=A0AAD4MNE9_9BILA|nr:hypothetical protein DdX_19291 [Ditylenchus destructor]